MAQFAGLSTYTFNTFMENNLVVMENCMGQGFLVAGTHAWGASRIMWGVEMAENKSRHLRKKILTSQLLLISPCSLSSSLRSQAA